MNAHYLKHARTTCSKRHTNTFYSVNLNWFNQFIQPDPMNATRWRYHMNIMWFIWKCRKKKKKKVSIKLSPNHQWSVSRSHWNIYNEIVQIYMKLVCYTFIFCFSVQFHGQLPLQRKCDANLIAHLSSNNSKWRTAIFYFMSDFKQKHKPGFTDRA